MSIDNDDARILADVIWSDWTQKFGVKPKMTWIALYQIARYFLAETKERGIDPQEIDVRAELDSQLSYEENRKIVNDLLAFKPSPREEAEKAEGQALEYLQQEINRLTGEAAPYRVVREEDLDKLLEKESQNVKLRETIKQLRAQWKREGEEKAETAERLKELEEEVKKKPAVTIEILTNFREGIQYFKKDDIIETHNIEWALQKIEQGLARRVGAVPLKPVEEKPKEVKAPAAPESERDRANFLKRLYRSILERNNVPTSYLYNDFLIELENVIMPSPREEQEKQVENIAMASVREYQSKREVAVAKRLPIAAERPTVMEAPEGEELMPPRAKLPKPVPGQNADLWIWLLANYGDLLKVSESWRPEYIKGMPKELRREVKRKFYDQAQDEQKSLLAQFHSHFPKIIGSLQEWLEKRKGIKYEDYVNMSNFEKAELFDEFVRFG